MHLKNIDSPALMIKSYNQVKSDIHDLSLNSDNDRFRDFRNIRELYSMYKYICCNVPCECSAVQTSKIVKS
jgi:hypothetical protein